jgi:hypothetical protein
MKKITILSILTIGVLTTNLFSIQKENKPVTQKNWGLGYFSNPSENIVDVYHYGNFPDSSFYYYNNNDGNGLILSGKAYYKDELKTVSATCYDYSPDLFYYSENGLLDSAILVSEADQEYDDYAIKHIYTYNDGLMATEGVYVDNINDSVSDDWNYVQKIEFTYDANLRIKEKLIEHLTWQPDVYFEKTAYYYSDSSSKGITQTDTCFMVSTTGEKKAISITIKKVTPENLCTEANYFDFASPYLLKTDSFGTPVLGKEVTMTYDNNKNLLTEEIDYNNNAQPSGYKNIYEYNTDNTRKLKTVYLKFDIGLELTYQYKYFYKLSGTNISNTEETEIRLFPNPVNDVLNIEGIPIGSEFIIYSTEGKIVKNQRLTENAISVSDLSNGVYILKTTDSKGQLLNRIFIKR